MAPKKVVQISKPKKATVKEQLAALKTRVSEYFSARRWRTHDNFQITLPAKAEDGKTDKLFNVPSLMAAVLTAQGLGKEVRLVAEPATDGGRLYVRFYSPVPTAGLDNLR